MFWFQMNFVSEMKYDQIIENSMKIIHMDNSVSYLLFCFFFIIIAWCIHFVPLCAC